MSGATGTLEAGGIRFAEAVDVAPIPLNAASFGGLLSFLMMLGARNGRMNVRVALGAMLPARRMGEATMAG